MLFSSIGVASYTEIYIPTSPWEKKRLHLKIYCTAKTIITGTPLRSKSLKNEISISYIDKPGQLKQKDMQRINKKYT
jgi:hypothetical protein